MSEKNLSDKAQAIVRNKAAYARIFCWNRYPELMRYHSEDAWQEIETLMILYPGKMTVAVWRRVVDSAFRGLAKDLGVKNTGRSYQQIEVPFSVVFDTESNEKPSIDGLLVTLSLDDDTRPDPGLTEEYELKYEICRRVLAGDESIFNSNQARVDWQLFLAWLHGWSRQEIKVAFGLNGELDKKLTELAQRIRNAAFVETNEQLPLPKFGRVSYLRLVSLIENKALSLPTRPRFFISKNLSATQIQKRFYCSRTTAWRARKMGWLVPGLRFPDPNSVRPEIGPPETIMDLETPAGRKRTREVLAGRDGWWVESETIWVRCGLCGEPLWLSHSSIDHILPKNLGGEDILGNLQLTHKECNQDKGDNLPSLRDLVLFLE